MTIRITELTISNAYNIVTKREDIIVKSLADVAAYIMQAPPAHIVADTTTASLLRTIYNIY